MNATSLAERYFGGDRDSTGPDEFDGLVALLEEYGAGAVSKLSGQIVCLCNGDKQHADADNNIMILDDMLRRRNDTIFDLRRDLAGMIKSCDQLGEENSILKSNVSETKQECARLDAELKRFTGA